MDQVARTAIPTRESLADLGRLIIETSLDPYQATLGTPLLVGFSNLVFEITDITKALSSPSSRANTL
jgi:hypothetical protein